MTQSVSKPAGASKGDPPWLREDDHYLGAPQSLWDAFIEKRGIATVAGLFADRESLKRELVKFWRRQGA